MAEIVQHSIYKGRLRFRRGDVRVRPEIEHLDGREVTLYAAWFIEPDEPFAKPFYHGEWAMMFWGESRESSPIPWIASGDVLDLRPARSTHPEAVI